MLIIVLIVEFGPILLLMLKKNVELQIMVVDVGSDFDSLHEFCTIPPTIVRAFLFYIDSRKEEPVPNFRLNRFS